LAAKTVGLLARLSENSEATLSADKVKAAAKVGNLNPKTELNSCLEHLEKRKLISVSNGGDVAVLGITGASALSHAADLFNDNDPDPVELASITLAEIASKAPISEKLAIEYVGDLHKLKGIAAQDFVHQASQIGFVDSEGSGDDKLIFNGNLFRRENATKVKKVIDSLSSEEQAKIIEFNDALKKRGAATLKDAKNILGDALFSKSRSAALYDVNIVSNESGEHAFVTSPGAFHKFSDPMTEDAFDHAKALVSALTYGMVHSSQARGQIWGIGLLLGKLIRGEWVGPATAIGNDYQALELERVVETKPAGYGFRMRLLKREVGVIALEVLQGRSAAATALETLPSAGMRGYIAPEVARVRFRRSQSSVSKAQTRSLLSAVRGGGGL